MIDVLLDELMRAHIETVSLPLPNDKRLRRVLESMLHEPSSKVGVDEWAKRLGLSERSLRRLVLGQTGMSLSRYRQQLHVTAAIRRLGCGEPVQRVALELGYESASSFIAMFRRVLGTSPARYIAERRARQLAR